MLKLYFKIVKAHRNTIFMYIAIFLAIFTMFAMVSGDSLESSTFAETKPTVAILNHDDSELSKLVIKQLEKESELMDVGETMEEMQDALFFAQINTIIEIPNNFQERYEAGEQNIIKLQQRPDHATGVLTQQKLTSFLDSITAYRSVDSSLSYQDAGKLVSKDFEQKTAVKMEKSKKKRADDSLRTNFYNFLSYVLFSVIVMTAGAAMHAIYRSEMLKRTLIAPINSTLINIRVVSANIIFGFSLLTIFTIVIMCSSNRMFTASGMLLILNSVIFTLVSIAFAYLTTTFITNKKNSHDKLDMICNVVGLVMAFLGGAFLPLDFIPDNVLQISRFLPTYWYVRLNDMMTSVTDVTSDVMKEVYQCIGIQMLFAITFVVIGLVIMKNKRSQGEIIDSDNE